MFYINLQYIIAMHFELWVAMHIFYKFNLIAQLVEIG